MFLDANILFSAAKSDGAVRELLRMLMHAGHECLADDFVVTEARRNLLVKGPQALNEFEALITRMKVSPAQTPDPSMKETGWLPEKDRPVLSAAIRWRCDVLVTGDRTHFGAGYGKVFGGVTIHSPQSLLSTLWPSSP